MKNTALERETLREAGRGATHPATSTPTLPHQPRPVSLFSAAHMATVVDKPVPSFPRRTTRTFPAFRPREVLD